MELEDYDFADMVRRYHAMHNDINLKKEWRKRELGNTANIIVPPDQDWWNEWHRYCMMMVLAHNFGCSPDHLFEADENIDEIFAVLAELLKA